jgi:hypothetical protein
MALVMALPGDLMLASTQCEYGAADRLLRNFGTFGWMIVIPAIRLER